MREGWVDMARERRTRRKRERRERRDALAQRVQPVAPFLDLSPDSNAVCRRDAEALFADSSHEALDKNDAPLERAVRGLNLQQPTNLLVGLRQLIAIKRAGVVAPHIIREA